MKTKKKRLSFLVKLFTKRSKMECYICFETYEVEGIECYTCKKSCCGDCYMKMYIASKDTVKCGLCRFQVNKKPYTGQLFTLLVEGRALRCGFSKEKALEWVMLAKS